MHGLDDLLARLKSLPPEIVSKRGGPVKAGLRKGAVVIQKAAKQKIRNVTTSPPTEGYASTKTLENAVVVVRSKNPQKKGANEAYTVLVTRGKKGVYPPRDGQHDPTKAIATGRYLEYGTEKQSPEPWMTPAYFEARERALEAAVDGMRKGVESAIRKVSKGAK